MSRRTIREALEEFQRRETTRRSAAVRTLRAYMELRRAGVDAW